jgi:hypothetical protein
MHEDLIKRLRHETLHTGYKPTKPFDLLIEAADALEAMQAAPILTDEQIDAIARTCQNSDGTVVYLLLARAIERAIRGQR